ncbi:MAG: NAD(P)/FAD-dependent oxidoreductase [Pseudomonadota bacterium]
MKILIVGAGPTGLTAALELARRGVLADVIDSKDGPSSLSRAVSLMPSSLAILARSGIADQIQAKAIATETAIFHAGSRRIATLDLARAEDPGHRLFALPQDVTEAVLRSAFERMGGRIRFGERLESIAQGAAGVDARIGGEIVTYDFVVGADGVRSTVREQLGIAYSGLDLPDEWSIADVEVSGWPYPKDFAFFSVPPTAAVIAIPLGQDRLRVIATTGDAIAALPIPVTVRTTRRNGKFRVSVRQADLYQSGAVFLAGDAAHCHSPVGGRGMNLGMADAADLARRLVRDDLDGYTRARHAAGQKVIAESERRRKLIASQHVWIRRAFHGWLRLIDHVPPIKRGIERELIGISGAGHRPL